MANMDRDQIQELMNTYAACVDSRDYDGLANCFLGEANASYGDKTCYGRDAIMALMKFMLTPLDVTQHNFMNFIIEVDGNKARLRANIMAQHVKYNTPGGDNYMGGGRYNVELQRDGGKWLIAQVKAGRVWAEGNPGVMPKAS